MLFNPRNVFWFFKKLLPGVTAFFYAETGVLCAGALLLKKIFFAVKNLYIYLVTETEFLFYQTYKAAVLPKSFSIHTLQYCNH